MRKPLEIVAEISANHGSDRELALALIRQAAVAGADSVKFQCWTAGTMAIARGKKAGMLWPDQDLVDLYAAAHTPWEWFPLLFQEARSFGLRPFASVFDTQALAFLESIGCPRYKIASAELIDLPLIRATAATGKPLVISTGMGSQQEIHEAWEASMIAGCEDLTILHCVSAYPTPDEGVNLQTMLHLGEQYRGRAWVGLSDHTTGIAAAVTAAAVGASMIEKHLTMRTNTLDADFSLFADEFRKMVRECRSAAKMMGDVAYGPRPGDASELRRTLHFARDLPEGHVLEAEDLVTSRPADGMHARDAKDVIGRRLAIAVSRGDPVTPLPLVIE